MLGLRVDMERNACETFELLLLARITECFSEIYQ